MPVNFPESSMSCIEITEENFNEVVDNNPIVILDFGATWNGACRSFEPIFEAASRRHADITFGNINTDTQTSLATSFLISSLPTLTVIRDRVIVFRQAAALPENSLEQLIETIKTLDMDVIRSRLSRRKPGERHHARSASHF
jgi:thioredoxin 1/thioredoxin 2